MTNISSFVLNDIDSNKNNILKQNFTKQTNKLMAIYKRYNIPFSICLIKFKDNFLNNYNFDFNDFDNIIRINDEYLKIDNKYHLFFFFHANEKDTNLVLYKVERELIKKYPNIDSNNIFDNTILECKDILINKDHKNDYHFYDDIYKNLIKNLDKFNYKRINF